MKIIAIVNHKGGVAKTTSVMNIGAGLHRLKKRVLVVDLDPQAHLTKGLGIHSNALEHTVFDVLKSELPIKEAIISRDGLDVLPANLDLANADIELSSQPGRDSLLKRAFLQAKHYDYIIMDCPPSLGILTTNALTAASDAFISLQTEYLALEGIAQLLSVIRLIRERTNKSLNISGVICTMYNSKLRLHKEVVTSAIERFGNKMFRTPIRQNIALAEAPSHGKTIFEYDPKSTGAEDYLNLCKEIIKRK